MNRSVESLVPRGRSELQDPRRHQERPGHDVWLVQISWSLQRRPGTGVHRGAGILGNEINAQPSDDGFGVVFVQTVKGEAVVEPSRHLEEHLTSDLEIHLGPRPATASAVARNWSNGGSTALGGIT